MQFLDLSDIIYFQTKKDFIYTEKIINELIQKDIIKENDEYLNLKKERDSLSFDKFELEIDLKEVLPCLTISHHYLSVLFNFLKKKGKIETYPVSLAKKNQSLKIGDSWVRFIKKI